MNHLLSLFILICFAWPTITQALPDFYEIGSLTAPKTLGGHIQYQGLKAGVDAGVNLAANGEISIEHLARGFIAGVIGAHLANQIGAGYRRSHIDGLTHKIMHATTGAFVGVILDERGNPLAGAAAGALGAFVAETYKLGVIDFAKNNFNIKLDSSNQSIKCVEEILEKLH